MKSIKKVIIRDEKYEDGYSQLIAKISEKGDLVIDGCRMRMRMGGVKGRMTECRMGSGHRNMLIL